MRKKRTTPPTAMTDIAFLLLLFFLILAITTHTLPEPIQPAQTASSTTYETTDAILMVTPEGTLYYQGKSITLEEIPTTEEISLLADKNTPFKTIAPVIDALKKKGITTLHCIVEESL